MSNQRNQKTADLIDKMCRKISQLTRVVYILNTKNDDHESLINAIVLGYENDMFNMTRECNIQMKKMKQYVDKIKEQNNPEPKLKAINEKYNNQVKLFSTDFDGMRKEVKEKHKKMKDEYNDKYNKMIKESAEMKKLFQDKINELNKKHEENLRKNLLEQQRLASNSSSEMERIKKGYEQQISELKNKHNKEMEDLKNSLLSQMEKMKADYEKKIKEYQTMLEKMEESIAMEKSLLKLYLEKYDSTRQEDEAL